MKKFTENRESIKKQPFCIKNDPFAKMKKLAKLRIKKELDLVKFMKKQRVMTNLLWGLTTPWQRTLCRQQALLLLRDKDEAEFLSYKLPTVRRTHEEE